MGRVQGASLSQAEKEKLSFKGREGELQKHLQQSALAATSPLGRRGLPRTSITPGQPGPASGVVFIQP